MINNDFEDSRSLQDKAYDLIGDMLIERDTKKFIAETNDTSGSSGIPSDIIQQNDRLYYRMINKHCRKLAFLRLVKVTLPGIFKVVSIMICVLFLTGGIAFAASKTVRLQVMRFIIRVEKQYTELSLIEDELFVLDVPAEWKGSSYPAFIPEGMRVAQVFSDPAMIMYHDEKDGDKRIIFQESDESSVTNIDTENAVSTTVAVNNYIGYMTVKENRAFIFWTDNEHYYIISSRGIAEDMALQVARSVKKIK